MIKDLGLCRLQQNNGLRGWGRRGSGRHIWWERETVEHRWCHREEALWRWCGQWDILVPQCSTLLSWWRGIWIEEMGMFWHRMTCVRWLLPPVEATIVFVMKVQQHNVTFRCFVFFLGFPQTRSYNVRSRQTLVSHCPLAVRKCYFNRPIIKKMTYMPLHHHVQQLQIAFSQRHF